MAAAVESLALANPRGSKTRIHRNSSSPETQSSRVFSQLRSNQNLGLQSPNLARAILQGMSQAKAGNNVGPLVDTMAKLFPAGMDKQKIKSAIESFAGKLSQIEGLQPRVNSLMTEATTKVTQGASLKDLASLVVTNFNTLKHDFPGLNAALADYAKNLTAAFGDKSGKSLARLVKMGFGEREIQLKQVLAILKLMGLEQANLKQFLKAFQLS